MKFTLNGRELALQGLKPLINSLKEEPKLNKATMEKGRGLSLQLMKAEETDIPEVPDEAIHVLGQFQSVFEEPKGLPPTRGRDHQIRLHEAATPTVRPYRYPYY